MPLEKDVECSPAILKLRERLSKLETQEGRLKGLSFKPNPSDVFIVTSPKAGTTWVQQIVHQVVIKRETVSTV
jgi:hypothetical protein